MARRKWTAEEIEEWRRAKGNRAFGYFNKEDSNIFVRKSFGVGWTFNWGNPVAWAVIAVLVVLVVWSMFNGKAPAQ